ncbi:MAG: cell division protein FtsA, partial [Lachnospiraceae bacterium]|nr:cell division protein FtsA [Lachnospiraceae bacterium]
VIEITPSTEGKDAHATIADLPEYESTITFIVNGQTVYCPRYAEVDGRLQPPTYEIKEGDCIEMRNYYTVEQLVQFMDVEIAYDSVIYVNNVSVDPDEQVFENFTVDFMIIEPDFGGDEDEEEKEGQEGTEEAAEGAEAAEGTEGSEEAEDAESAEASEGAEAAEESSENVEGPETTEAPEEASEEKTEDAGLGFNRNLGISVTINGENYVMQGKDSFSFVDIFDYIKFNMNESKGRSIITTINGSDCGYTDTLKDGDVIVVKWSED